MINFLILFMFFLKTDLYSKFGIRGIPTFVIIDGNSGTVHTLDGRSKKKEVISMAVNYHGQLD
jgi:hypothetical protein